MANPTFSEDYSAIENITKKKLLCSQKQNKEAVFAVQLAKNKKPDQLGRLKVAYPISFVDGKFEQVMAWNNVPGISVTLATR